MPLFDYLATIPTAHKAAWLFGCLMLITAIEFIAPMVPAANRRANLKVNLSLLAIVVVINGIVSALLAFTLAALESANIGLFHAMALPWWAELIIAFLALDLIAQYTAHYLLHNVPALWRLHQIHHSDTEVNATTGTRHHPLDYVVRESLSFVVTCALGIPIAYYVLYRLTTVFFTYFTHGNIRLPERLDRALSLVVVTPGLHKFHHHYKMPWTNRNYGNIFSIWDRLFGTFVYDDTARIVYGVDTMDAARAHELGYQLKAPFRSS